MYKDRFRVPSRLLPFCFLASVFPRSSPKRFQSFPELSQSFPRASAELPRASPEVHRASPELSRASSKHAQSSPERWGSTCWRPSIRIYSIRIYMYTHAQTYTYDMYRCMYRLILRRQLANKLGNSTAQPYKLANV